MAITEIFEFEFPKAEVEAAKQEMARLRGELVQYREQNKALKKEGKENSAQFNDNALAIKKLSGELRTNERVVVANTKAQAANKGSIEQLRGQLSVVTDQWSKLSKEERENTEAGQKLVKQKLALTNELKNLEKQTGDTRRNVGNYSEGMQEALKSTGLFAREQRALATAQKILTTATKAQITVTHALKIALASTGIGAVIVLLGTLATYLTSTQEGMDKVTSVTRPLMAIFEKMKGVVQELGGSVFKGLAMILNGDIKEGLKTLGSGFTDAFENAKDAVTEGNEVGKQIDKLTKDIEKTEVTLAKRRAELNAEYERSKEIAQDQSKSEGERKKAAEAAIKAQNELLEQEQQFLQKKIDLQELINSQNDTDRKDQQSVNDLIAERTQLEANAARKRASANNLLNTINKKAREDEKKAAADALKAQEEADKEYFKNLAESIDEGTERKITALKEQLLAEEITREEFNQQLYDMELAALEAELELNRLYGKKTVDLESSIVDKQLAEKQRKVDAAAKLAEQEANNAKTAEEIKKNAASSTASAVAGFLTQTGKQNKQAASIAAIINTAQGVSASLKEGGVLGLIQAAITAATGAIQIAKINSTKVPQFATGVIGLEGPGTDTSDSISARLSKGESVVTAKATRQYAPVLAEMERSVGNTPNYRLGSRHFATGVINAGVRAADMNARTASSTQNSFTESLKRVNIVTRITDIERVQRQNAQANSIAEITD